MKGDPGCILCKRHKSAAEVCEMGSGDRTAEIMVVFDTPGFINMGFIGDKMRLDVLNLLIEAGVMKDKHDDKNIYVTHAVACQHPDGKAPSKGEIQKCRTWLNYQIKRIRPKFILSVGSVPLASITEGKQGIKKARGKPFEHLGAVVVPVYSPGIMKHDERMIPVVKRDFQLFKQCIDFGGIPQSKDLDYTVVDDWDKVKAMLKDLRGTVAADTETSRLYPFHTVMDEKLKQGRATDQEIREHSAQHGNIDPPRLVALQFATKRKQWVIPMETAGIWTRKQLEKIVGLLDRKLEGCYLVGHNWKFDHLWMRVRFGVKWDADFDTMIAHYMLDENERHGLKELAMVFCEAVDWEIDKEEKQAWSEKNAKYAAHDVFYTRKLAFLFGAELRKDLDVERVFRHIMMPCSKMFSRAEFEGVTIDLAKMNDAEKFLRDEVAKYEKALAKYEPEPKIIEKGKKGQKKKIEVPFNWGSPQQVARLLFTDLDIEPTEYTDSGAPSTSESALKQIDHPLVSTLLKLRGARQQLSFFIEGWKPYLDLKGRLHPSFKLTGTVTGRLSCENPNLQQVPRDPRIRTLIIAMLGWDMNECDLSQIELRIAAHAANERNMIQAFITGVDVHWLTALREIERGAGLKKEIEETVKAYYKKYKKGQQPPTKYGAMVECLLKEIGPDKAAELAPHWKEFRKKAKAINFGYLYGMWWKKFKIYARDNYDVEVTDEQAQESRIAFFTNYPDFTPWHKRQKRFARMNGYVRSLSGRKRRLPDAMRVKDDYKRQEAERQAVNSPIQSFANELNLMAALQLMEEFGWDVLRIVGTIHDAVLFMTRRDMTVKIHKRMLEIMQRPKLMDEWEINMKVPILADGKIGPWGAGKELKKWLAENDNDTSQKKKAA